MPARAPIRHAATRPGGTPYGARDRSGDRRRRAPARARRGSSHHQTLAGRPPGGGPARRGPGRDGRRRPGSGRAGPLRAPARCGDAPGTATPRRSRPGPSEALAGATVVTARHFGLSDRGRIAPGLRADLLLVDGDPVTDITATRSIVVVRRRGVRRQR
ncbi:amidohydrolase family protein [Streptomyces sp. NPDC014779]|uniref:amidohydrolase family protein n=1 Tax=unclassified Streptomyces TaxID=2593676 RepID=UPI0036F67CDD